MINLYRYRLRFKKTFHNSSHSWEFRKGLLIRYSSNGTDLASEAAPLPGFSSESIPDVLKIFAADHKIVDEFLNDVCDMNNIKSFFNQHNYPPSVQFAISCLALDLVKLRNKKQELPGTLFKNRSSIAVNAVVGIGSHQEVRSSIQRLYKAGYRTIKLKCSKDPAPLADIVLKAADTFPNLRFRLDANRSWPADKALKILENFSGLPVEYCEEPFLFHNLEEVAAFRACSPIPIALDESIDNLRTAARVLDMHAADVIIIKPMILGNIIDLIETFTTESAHSIDRVCTTSLESAVGRKAVAKAASLFGSGHLAHGLDTGRLLKDDIYMAPGEKETNQAKVPETWCIRFSRCDTTLISELDL